VRYIDEHKEVFGVEPICKELQIAPSTYYAQKTRPPSKMCLRHEAMKQRIEEVFDQNYRVYGIHKVWKQLGREGETAGRDQVGRLMGELGFEGVRRGKRRKTTKADPSAPRPPDLVDRDFSASRPNQLWVADFTYVSTWSGFCYAAFVIDVFSRMIVGWRVATSMTTDLVLDTLEMALWRRDERVAGVICHSDAGSQYTSIRYTERLDEVHAAPSIGSRGDSYDNAMAESVIGLYKTELIRPRGPWHNAEEVELATLPYVDWFNSTRLHTEIGDVPPAEFEATYYRQTEATEAA
jgi:putative transposase